MTDIKQATNAATIDWAKIPDHTILTKFKAVSLGSNEINTPTVELHGLVDQDGTIYIVEEIITYP